MPALYIHTSPRGGFVVASSSLLETTGAKSKHATVQWLARAFDFAPTGAQQPVIMGPRASIAVEGREGGASVLVVRALQGFVLAEETFMARSKSANWRAQMLIQSFWGDLLSPEPCPFEPDLLPERCEVAFIEGASRWTPGAVESDAVRLFAPFPSPPPHLRAGVAPFIPGFERERSAG